ncbi:hypothetical protein Lesp02_20340 [Lentzea sp. NBRC 105346]|uniref:helix-turn-helix domain-containing protein n=1 Tax=Lentzea sp. NBRC 105346 TaxID=3032205 RepID=UPI00249FAD8A|nr:helix-turn-helix domain-containing protein [Lentzea sp. NBRC 105346]GLZ29844.1 hypothetical protein Lesp02_20340 [Lentzea sp. NBRC 105346]
MFEILGLTPAEERLWQTLVDRPPATARELGANVHGTLAALCAKGLAIRLSGRPVRYTAAAPDEALDALFRAREEELRQARVLTGQLVDRYRSRRASPGEVVEVVRGSDAVFHRWRQIQRTARAELCGLHRPPFLTEPAPDEIRVPSRTVYDHSVAEMPGMLDRIAELVESGEQARIGSVPVKALLADDRIGMISLATTDSVLVVHASALLTALRTLFDRIWASSTPLAGSEGTDNRRLLTLLAAGLTDQAIARQFGWHLRTVQRRVRRIMAELGVRTRFQAGLQAGRRGWL